MEMYYQVAFQRRSSFIVDVVTFCHKFILKLVDTETRMLISKSFKYNQHRQAVRYLILQVTSTHLCRSRIRIPFCIVVKNLIPFPFPFYPLSHKRE